MFLLNKNHLVFICSLFHLNRILYQCTKKEENKISKASSFTLITAQTYPLAVIGQVCVTSITVAHLSALIPPSHFTPFLLPLHKLCCQWGLVKKKRSSISISAGDSTPRLELWQVLPWKPHNRAVWEAPPPGLWLAGWNQSTFTDHTSLFFTHHNLFHGTY